MFVENHIKEILKENDVTFHYVTSDQIPADCNQVWNQITLRSLWPAWNTSETPPEVLEQVECIVKQQECHLRYQFLLHVVDKNQPYLWKNLINLTIIAIIYPQVNFHHISPHRCITKKHFLKPMSSNWWLFDDWTKEIKQLLSRQIIRQKFILLQ